MCRFRLALFSFVVRFLVARSSLVSFAICWFLLALVTFAFLSVPTGSIVHRSTSIGHLSNIFWRSVEHQSNIDRTYIERDRDSIEHLSNIDRQSIGHLSEIYRASTEPLSYTYRTSIEHISVIDRKSIKIDRTFWLYLLSFCVRFLLALVSFAFSSVDFTPISYSAVFLR